MLDLFIVYAGLIPVWRWILARFIMYDGLIHYVCWIDSLYGVGFIVYVGFIPVC
jgi:hypothetical protein